MIKLLAKWVAPGLVTVLGGAALAVLMTSANVALDIETRASTTLLDGGDAWAELSVNARDIVLRGTTADQQRLDAAIVRLQALHGVRSVNADVQLAPLASPYPFTASIDDGKITLQGGVPDLAVREQLLARAGADDHGLQLLAGMPQRDDWLAGVQFAIDQLGHFDQGQAVASNLTFTLSGRARSADDFRDVLLALKNDVPPAVVLGKVEVAPPLVSPYRWSATSDGKLISVSGYVPDIAVTDRLRTADASGLPVATGLALASGEPQGFADNAQRLLHNLSRLEYGTASIVDGKQTLTGAPATLEIAQAITQDLAQAGSIITLEPPRIPDYWMSATRQSGGVIVFDGYAPDDATRKRLSEVENADTNFLKLGRGAPERYQAAVDFGLSVLDHLSEGRFALRDNIVTLTGIARSGADYDALAALIAAGTPQGLVLARSEIKAAPATVYAWSATKANGSIAVEGMVPDPAAKAALAAATGNPAVDGVTYASGEPVGFIASAVTALELLQWLETGTVRYDGAGWTISGAAANAIDQGAIQADFTTRNLAAAGWSLDLTAAPAAPVAISPYVWSVSHGSDGAISFSGHVPTEAMKRFFVVHAGTKVVDTTEVGAGAPDNFIAEASLVLDVVLGLDSGSATFDGTRWTITGTAASSGIRDELVAKLAAPAFSPDLISITAPEATEPVTATEPPVVEEPAATPVDPAYTFSASRDATSAVTMSGQLPADPALRYFGVITGAPTTGVTIAGGAPEDFILSAETGLRGLIELDNSQLRFADGKWSLSGKAQTNADSDAIKATIAALPAGAGWTLAITAPPPLDACQADVAAFSARNSILFQSGAAIIAAESEPALDELALYLAKCPEADVDVEGHTDADGDDTLNLALSVARAEAVISALIARNIAPQRLYAVGYGESDPVADNETSAGKRLNRRIVIKVLEHHI